MKKIFYLSIVLLIGLSLLTGCDKNVENKKKTLAISYSIGDEVTLKDNTTWYVIEDSDSSSDTVTLIASQNMKNDASGWTTTPSEYEIAFDEKNVRTTENNSYCTDPLYGCNMYAAQSGTITNGEHSGTVTEDSTIKKFLEGDVTNYINNSLTSNGGTSINSIRLLTQDEYFSVYIPNDLINYWTMTPLTSDMRNVYYIDYNSLIRQSCASCRRGVGVRPVIVTLKSNIK